MRATFALLAVVALAAMLADAAPAALLAAATHAAMLTYANPTAIFADAALAAMLTKGRTAALPAVVGYTAMLTALGAAVCKTATLTGASGAARFDGSFRRDCTARRASTSFHARHGRRGSRGGHLVACVRSSGAGGRTA